MGKLNEGREQSILQHIRKMGPQTVDGVVQRFAGASVRGRQLVLGSIQFLLGKGRLRKRDGKIHLPTLQSSDASQKDGK